MQTALSKSVDELAKALRKDKKLYQTWQANIAHCIREEMQLRRTIKAVRSLNIKPMPDAAAMRFLNLLINKKPAPPGR
jgi:hypothetical protein